MFLGLANRGYSFSLPGSFSVYIFLLNMKWEASQVPTTTMGLPRVGGWVGPHQIMFYHFLKGWFFTRLLIPNCTLKYLQAKGKVF